MVERYASNGCEKSMYAISEGKWVRYSDYAALEVENARLKEALRGCVRIGESLGCTDPDCQHVSCAMLKKAREVLGDAYALSAMLRVPQVGRQV